MVETVQLSEIESHSDKGISTLYASAAIKFPPLTIYNPTAFPIVSLPPEESEEPGLLPMVFPLGVLLLLLQLGELLFQFLATGGPADGSAEMAPLVLESEKRTQ